MHFTRILCTTLLALAGCSAPDNSLHSATDIPSPANANGPVPTPPSAVAPATAPTTLAEKMLSLDRNLYRIPVDGLPFLGNAQALVTVVLFSDYACPFCHRLEAELTRLRAEYGDDLRVVFAPRPLPMHPRARGAALASLAAAAQGKFAPMHARLLDGKLDDAALTAAAAEIGLDMTRFEADRTGADAAKVLERVAETATRYSIVGVPTVYINGRRVTGAQRDLVRQVIVDQLTSARAIVASGNDRRQLYDTITAKGLERADLDPSITLLPKFAPGH